MVGYYNNQGVPNSADLENNSNQKKYTVNRNGKHGVVIPKALCVLMVIGALLLAILVGLIVFFVVPRYCDQEKLPAVSTNQQTSSVNNSPEKIEESAVGHEIDERLPKNVEPTHYKLRILPDLRNGTTQGSIAITLKVIQDTDEVLFHLRDIFIDKHSVSIRSTSDSSQLVIREQNYIEGDKYKIKLLKNLNKNEEYVLNLEFKGRLNGHLKGFYKSKYYDRQGKKRLIASTQFSPVDARSAFPCYDEPSFKAKFQITLGRPSSMTTLSNMPILNSTLFATNTSGVWSWDEYPETPKMSTYLVAFMVTDLIESPSKGEIIKFWAREDLVSQTAYPAEIGSKLLKFYEEYFDVEFPLPKIDVVALPEFGFNAMENWGLITFREDVLLYDPSSSTNEDKRLTATVLSHELAHQWFGNLVTPSFWNDLWLKEGFSNYMVYMGIDTVEPTWRFGEEFIPSETLVAMNEDALENSRPISLDGAKNSNQIRQLFDPISYSKGAAIIRMMNHFLGEETFKAGLVKFLKKYRNSNADRNDLFETFTEVAHTNNVLPSNESVKTIMDTWVERAGYPVVNAIANYAQNKIKLFQKRFYFREKDEKSSWWIPLSFTTNINTTYNDTTPKFWLKGEYEIDRDVDLTNATWYLLNLYQTGYFVVNYDERNWMNLIDNIMVLPTTIRAQLIADSMDLARANLISYDIPLKMIARMAVNDKDIMFVPTAIAFEKLRYLSDILSSTPAFGLFEEYHRTIFKETYDKVTLVDPIDDYRTRRIRSTVLNWSCRSPDSRCSHMSRTFFRSWLSGTKKIEPNLRKIVYCTALREGGQVEWNFAYKKFLETASLSEKKILLDALGCTKLTWLLSRYLDKLLDDYSIRIQDADRLFGSVVSNKIGTQIAFDFLRKNWNALIKRHGDGFNIIAKMVKSLGPQLNTEFQLSELIRFRDSVNGNRSAYARAFDIAVETVRGNVEWMEKNYRQVEQWFQKYKDRFDYV
ncbi:aminopeptidase N-like isoform X2 [Diorhabda sublineata]|uniref:aminopeptidase N-like isoform X2 n=1 Tax=Diorhabda sublineata TaxID=1163346 RepID=UPI0024E10BFB|nr:aminopeptidase N-like isoform X2 [Diorhabda sublineata]